MIVILLLLAAAIPLGLSLWALLDAASRPAWAWALAGRSQLVWIAAIVAGVFVLLAGVGIALWYLARVRPVIRAIEEGDFGPMGDPAAT